MTDSSVISIIKTVLNTIQAFMAERTPSNRSEPIQIPDEIQKQGRVAVVSWLVAEQGMTLAQADKHLARIQGDYGARAIFVLRVSGTPIILRVKGTSEEEN